MLKETRAQSLTAAPQIQVGVCPAVTASHDVRERMTERHRRGSIILTSNRGLDESLATFSDPRLAGPSRRKQESNLKEYPPQPSVASLRSLRRG